MILDVPVHARIRLGAVRWSVEHADAMAHPRVLRASHKHGRHKSSSHENALQESTSHQNARHENATHNRTRFDRIYTELMWTRRESDAGTTPPQMPNRRWFDGPTRRR